MNGRIPMSIRACGRLSAAATPVVAGLAQALDRASSTAGAVSRRGLSACLRQASRLHRAPTGVAHLPEEAVRSDSAVQANLRPAVAPWNPPVLCVVLENGEAIGEARRLARAFLTDVKRAVEPSLSTSTTQLIELVVSELATNAHKYAPGPSRLSMEVHDGLVEVSVSDNNPNPPAIMPPNPLRIGQHGLPIVLAVARTFAIHRERAGKRITVAIALTQDETHY